MEIEWEDIEHSQNGMLQTYMKWVSAIGNGITNQNFG